MSKDPIFSKPTEETDAAPAPVRKRARNPNTYGLQRQYMDYALEQPRGLSKEFPSYGHAFSFQMGCYGVRKQDRAANRKIHPVGHPNHGRSIYDELIVSIEPTDPNETLTKSWPGPAILFILKKEDYLKELAADPTIRSL